MLVLNLVINGLPSIPKEEMKELIKKGAVLNLVINGLPSIHNRTIHSLETFI